MTDLVFRFDQAELRPATRQLLVNGQPSPIGARAFDLLQALVTRRERLVSKHELLDIVWPGVVVEENNLPVQIGRLRKLLGARAIATVPGRGYRFVAELQPVAGDAGRAAWPGLRPAVGNLDAQAAPLVGRDTELATLSALVRQHRLVSVLGAGGIGKTCLARAAAQQLRAQFPDGIWVVPLSDVSDAATLPAAIARGLETSLPMAGDPCSELAERLSGRQLLLIDNCEHMVWAVAAVVEHLLRAQPGLHVLATSQEALHLPDEQPLRLDALSVPPSEPLDGAETHAAVVLFTARVRAAQPDFALDAPHLRQVVAICRALDGVPLALEFAAARVPLLGVAGVHDHLGQRLRLLRAGARDVPPRHRTLRATMDWSHALLSPVEKTVFRRLGVFVGGFGPALAQALVADAQVQARDVPQLLRNLVDKSLVVADPGTAPRYRLTETARVYACEQLHQAGEWHALQRAHARCLAALFDRRADRAPLADWLQARQPETDNLRSAIEWATDAGERPLALDLVNLAADFMYQVGRSTECLAWMRRTAPLVDAHTPAAVAARFRFGLARAGLHGGLPGPERLQLLQQAQDALERQPAQPLLVHCLCLRACVAAVCGHATLARTSLARAAELVRQPALARLRGLYLAIEGVVWRYAARPDRALAAFLQAMPDLRLQGDDRTLFHLHCQLGATQQELGRLDAAAAQYRATLDWLARSPRTDALMVAMARNGYAHALTAQGRLDEAMAQVQASLPSCRRTVGLRHFAAALGLLAARQGRLRAATLLLGCDDAAHARRGEARAPLTERTLAETLALVAAAHPPERIAVWRLQGTALDDEAAQVLVVGAGTAR